MNKHFKKLVSLLLAIILTSSFTGFAFASDTNSTLNTDKDLTFTNVNYTKSDNIRVDLNNIMLTFTTNPQLINGTTLVPFRTIFESLGLTVNYDSTTQTVSGKNDKYDISLVLGSTTATVNKGNKTLSIAPKIINNSTMIPLRFISETLGYHIVWVGNSNLILISDKNILEWRYGGHEKDTAKNYEIEYINDVATSNTRYTGTLWTQSIILANTSGSVIVGSTYQISIASNTTTNQTVSYISSNPSIASVDSNGLVTGIIGGTTDITITNANNDTATIEITVISEEDNYKISCQNYTYDEIARYPENYIGKDAHFKGKIIQVVAPNSQYPKLGTILVEVTATVYGTVVIYSDVICVAYNIDNNRLLENDIIDLYGTMMGTITYSTALNIQKTVPNMFAEYIDLVQ